MIYCSCGGQKTCFKCDGKGWIDEPEAGAKDVVITFPPVLKEYSVMPEPSMEKINFGRRKPLIAQVKGNLSVPRSSSNIEAARTKKRKLVKATKKAETLEKLHELKQPTARQLKDQKRSRTKDKVLGKPALSFLTSEQSCQLAEHERKLAKLIEVLPGAGDVAEKVELRIQDEKRAIRKLRIKARRINQKQKATAQIRD